MRNEQLKQDLLDQLNRAYPEGLTARDMALALGLDTTKSRHYDVLSSMVTKNIIERERDGKKYFAIKAKASKTIVTEFDNAVKNGLKDISQDHANKLIADFLANDERVTTPAIEKDIYNINLIRRVLNKSIAELTANLKTTGHIINKAEKISELRLIAPQLCASSQQLLETIASDLEQLQ